MNTEKTVYILLQGHDYEGSGIHSIYSTLDAAKAQLQHQLKTFKRDRKDYLKHLKDVPEVIETDVSIHFYGSYYMIEEREVLD